MLLFRIFLKLLLMFRLFLVKNDLACVAGGIVCARAKFERRSREGNGKEAICRGTRRSWRLHHLNFTFAHKQYSQLRRLRAIVYYTAPRGGVPRGILDGWTEEREDITEHRLTLHFRIPYPRAMLSRAQSKSEAD